MYRVVLQARPLLDDNTPFAFQGTFSGRGLGVLPSESGNAERFLEAEPGPTDLRPGRG